MSKDMLGARLNTLHNLYYFSDLMQQIRLAIEGGSFSTFQREFYAQRESVMEDLEDLPIGDAAGGLRAE